MAFNVSCSPGSKAVAVSMWATGNPPSLVMELDSINVAIKLPPFPGGDVAMAEFCRELAWEAAKFAAEIDPDGEPIPPDRSPGYMVILGSSGGGC